MIRIILALMVLVAVGWGGFLLGSRGRRDQVALGAECTGAEASGPASATAPRGSADCQGVKNQLAICMAYQPQVDAAGRDEKDKYLAACRSELEMLKHRPTLPACWDFIDLAPVYDRELGEADPSPETLERAKSLSVEECAVVLTWSERAGLQQRTCLKGAVPAGFAERYGRPIRERPFVRACQSTDAYNAWQKREEERVRATGHEPNFTLRAGVDGGLIFSLPDGRSGPMIYEP